VFHVLIVTSKFIYKSEQDEVFEVHLHILRDYNLCWHLKKTIVILNLFQNLPSDEKQMLR